jgi:glycosyltransferase involved in cell wall biosynthesis
MTIELSVITPSFNQARFLPYCLNSIRSNRSVCKIEHLVLDGGSNDGSSDILTQWSNELDYWRSESDRGQSHAINCGMRMATGGILCWINSDDALAPGAAAIMSSILGSYSSPAWAIGQCLVIDEANNEINRWEPGSHDDLKYVLQWSRNYIMQPAVFWNRSMWNLAGPLDEDLDLAMDFDLWLRFFTVAPPILVNRPIGVHRTHGDSKTSHGGVRILGEYRRALTARLPESSSARRLGEADIARALSVHARTALFRNDIRYASELLVQSFALSPLRMLRDRSFLKGLLKLIFKNFGGGGPS